MLYVLQLQTRNCYKIKKEFLHIFLLHLRLNQTQIDLEPLKYLQNHIMFVDKYFEKV